MAHNRDRRRAVFLRQLQRGFTYAGLLFMFVGLTRFLVLFIAPAPIEQPFPILLLTAVSVGIGMFVIAMALDIACLALPRQLQGRQHDDGVIPASRFWLTMTCG